MSIYYKIYKARNSKDKIIVLNEEEDFNYMFCNKKAGNIRLGIIGTGRIAKRFVPEVEYVDGIQVEIAYNPRLISAKKFAEESKLNKYTDKIEEFYTNCDAVYIATPHNTHYKYIKDALEHGKHVLCEKPMVLKEKEAKELFQLASNHKLILMEALKTAYAPGFLELIANVESNKIGNICDVEASFTKLVPYSQAREFDINENGGSFTELGSYPLLAIAKILGRDCKDIKFVSFIDINGIDLYTKVYMRYENAIAMVKVGLGIKSEGNLVVSGTKGYVLAESPWWMTKGFEICYENRDENEKYSMEYEGQGLRYEIRVFISRINGMDKCEETFTSEDSIFLAEIMEKYLKLRKEGMIDIIKLEK